MGETSDQPVPSIEAPWEFVTNAVTFGCIELRLNRARNANSKSVLQREYVYETAVEAIRPDLAA